MWWTGTRASRKWTDWVSTPLEYQYLPTIKTSLFLNLNRQMWRDTDRKSVFFCPMHRKKSVEDILSGSHEAIGNSISQALSFTSGTVLQSSPIPLRRSPSPSDSPHNSPRQSYSKRDHSKYDTHLSVNYNINNDTTEVTIILTLTSISLTN